MAGRFGADRRGVAGEAQYGARMYAMGGVGISTCFVPFGVEDRTGAGGLDSAWG